MSAARPTRKNGGHASLLSSTEQLEICRRAEEWTGHAKQPHDLLANDCGVSGQTIRRTIGRVESIARQSKLMNSNAPSGAWGHEMQLTVMDGKSEPRSRPGFWNGLRALRRLCDSMDAQADAPCADCPTRARCATKRLACKDFAAYAYSTETRMRRLEPRQPERWVFDAIFTRADV